MDVHIRHRNLRNSLSDVPLYDSLPARITRFSPSFPSGSSHNPWQDRRHLHRCKIHVILMLFLVGLFCRSGHRYSGSCCGSAETVWTNPLPSASAPDRHSPRSKRSANAFCSVRLQSCSCSVTTSSPRFCLSSREQRSVVGRILEMYQFVCSLCRSFPAARDAVSPAMSFFVVSCVHHVLQRCDTDHKEFIQIGCCDTQKFQPFQIAEVRYLLPHPKMRLLNPSQLNSRFV